MRDIPDYACPECEWTPPDDGSFYFITPGGIEDCTEYSDITKKIFPNPPSGKIAYPIFDDYRFNIGVAINCGGNPHRWEETHFCPFCKKEFMFSNSDC
jgi:hypothetical protein